MAVRYQQGVSSPLGFMTKRGILGQVETSATTYTTLYEVPEGTSAEVYVVVASTGSGAQEFRIALDEDGTGTTPQSKEFVAYDVSLPNKDTFESPVYQLDEKSRIIVWASNSNLIFNAIGAEFVG